MPTIKSYKVKGMPDNGAFGAAIPADDPMDVVRDLIARVTTLQSAGVAYVVRANGDSILEIATGEHQTDGQRALGMAVQAQGVLREIQAGITTLLTPPPVPTVLTVTPPGPAKVAVEKKKRRGRAR